MILYQYIKKEWVEQIVIDEKLVFRCPLFFNDPLELTAADTPADLIVPALLSREVEGTTPERLISLTNSSEVMRRLQFTNCVATCLTRNPTNPLMWAHYCDNLGVVVGMDVDSSFFTGTHNLCPIQWGNMVYTATKPESMVYVDEHANPRDRWYFQDFEPANYERIQKAFLFKSQHWSYEEEVRLVKRANEGSEDSIRQLVKTTSGAELYLYRMPKGSVKEIYVPVTASWLDQFTLHQGTAEKADPYRESRAYFRGLAASGVSVYATYPSATSWGLKSQKVA